MVQIVLWNPRCLELRRLYFEVFMMSVATEFNAELDVLLGADQDFRMVPITGKYSDDGNVAVTWRWPRVKDGNLTAVISTAVVNAQKMHKLRVEEIDGQHFLINEPANNYEKEIRLCVESERVGSEMIRALIGLVATKPVPVLPIDEGEALGIPARLRRFNKMAEHLMPLACFTFCASLSLAAMVWILLD